MIVVDASVAAKWILPEEFSDNAKALYRAAVQTGEPIVAPPHFPAEVTNILRQRMRRTPPLPRGDALQLLTDFAAFPVDLLAPSGLHKQALILADDHDLPAVYDAYYVVLAQMQSCELWTDDRRLLRLLAGKLPFVRPVAAYQP